VSRRTDEINLSVPPEKAAGLIREALAQSGWSLQEESEGRMNATSGIGATRMPSRIEIELREAGRGTDLVLNGRIYGIGPIQKRHLNKLMDGLRGEIESRA
jgi:hypothetical protein